VTDPDTPEHVTDKLASEAKPVCEVAPDKPTSGRVRDQLRRRLQVASAALASIAAVGAIAGGLVGYWTVWKTLRTDIFQERQKTQTEAASRPDIAPRLSLVVLPFENVNNDPEQDYFADGITTDLTTDLAQMPGAFVIGRGPVRFRASRWTLWLNRNTEVRFWPDADLVQRLPTRQLLGVKWTRYAHRELFRV